MRTSLLASVAVIGAAVSVLAGIAPAHADASVDPLTRGDHVVYNGHDYRLSIAPVASAARVTRYGRSVPATYRVRMIDPAARGDVVVFSATLGYSRTAYLRTKTVSLDTRRPYGIRTYLQKITRFTADHAKRRVDHFVWESLHRVQRGDVAATVLNVQAFLQQHGTLTGADAAALIVSSDGSFGHRPATIRLITDPHRTGSAVDYAVYGFDAFDGYQVLFDSVTGRTTSTTNPDDSVLLP